jgi:3,4-dihydroxy 2-butanone 4-phosphate synthase/GTP cyclohydrolase II
MAAVDDDPQRYGTWVKRASGDAGHGKAAAAVALSSAEEIIAEARAGRMFILVDDEDRENEGDLIIPAQMATPDAVNFMARFGRGLICLAMTQARADRLDLKLMGQTDGDRHQTAFTVSIEAREGVTTGISAADRARTIQAAIDEANDASAIVSPGHIFPLIAREGGVLVRAGHTEAAVDIARLAGLVPAGVICEIMNEDGTMARLDDLRLFAGKHSLKIGAIRDLIAHRRRTDHIIECVASAPMKSVWGGDWTAMTYKNRITSAEQIALLKGRIDPHRPTLVRMHTFSFFADAFGEDSKRRAILKTSMRAIAHEGQGVIVIINRPTPHSMSRIMKAKAEASSTLAKTISELRDYGVGAEILADLGVRQMRLLTDGKPNLVALEGYGLSVVDTRPVTGSDHLWKFMHLSF